MKFIPAPGSLEMQKAINDPNVYRLVKGLLQVKNTPFFKQIVLFLRNHDQQTPSLIDKLNALRITNGIWPDARGNFDPHPHIEEIISSLEKLYMQNSPQAIGFQRGAIVELLATCLVSLHCESNECQNNYRFVEGQYVSDQVDVAVLSQSRQQMEGYTCKIKSASIISEDCTNLTALVSKARESGYEIHIGAVCFDNSYKITERINDRLRDIPFSVSIYAYGLNNFLELEYSPF